MNKGRGNYQSFGEKKSQSLKNSTFQKSESTSNRVGGSYNSRDNNIRERRVFLHRNTKWLASL